MVFFYHRVYDMMIFAMPLTFVATRTLSVAAPTRWLYTLSGFAQLFAIHPVGRLLKWIERDSWGWGIEGSIARGLVLPSTTWAILLAMAALALAAWREARPVSEPQPARLGRAVVPA